MLQRFHHLAAFFCILVLALYPGTAKAEKRVALVIGNATYQNTPALSNPVNDGEDLATALKGVGFTVVLERNLTKRGMEGAIARFARLAQDADTALFFYAGHGMQWRGANYLVPVDAKLEDEFNLNFELTRLDDVLFGLERARGVKILVLDACRNSPLLDRLNRTSSTRDLMATRGFAKIESTRGMVIAYSTQINQVAEDGPGRNSAFTQALVKEIDEPGVEIGTMFRRVAAHVSKVTDGRQLPELSVSLLGEFYLNTRETDLQAWSKIRFSRDPAALHDFLGRYPASPLAAEVRERLNTIDREQSARSERERVERERLAREQAERQRSDRERAEREQAKREEFARAEEGKKQTAKSEEERARLAHEQNERDKAEIQTAMLPPPTDAAAPATPVLSGGALVQEIKKELKRVGCYGGSIDDKWDSVDTKASVQKFAKFAKLQTVTSHPDRDLLDSIRGNSGRMCPLDCKATETEADERCITKTCRTDFVLGADGVCNRRKPQVETSAYSPDRPRQQNTSPRAALRRADLAYTTGTYSQCMGARTGCHERAIANGRTPEYARTWCSRRATC